MLEQERATQTLKVSEVKNRLSNLIDQVNQKRRTRYRIEKSGVPVAALVSIDDLARLEQFDREWDDRTMAIKRFSQAFADVPVEEAEAEIARIIAENRQRRAAEAERQPA